MCQRFIILLRVGPRNNARLKPVRSAKKVADPWLKASQNFQMITRVEGREVVLKSDFQKRLNQH